MNQKYEFRIEGLSPLLMHHDDVYWADRIAEERKRIKKDKKAKFKAGDDRCPPDTWKGYLYADGTRIVLPTDNLRACLLKAAAKVTLDGKTTYKSLSQSAILFDDVYLPLQIKGAVVATKEIDRITGEFMEQAKAVGKLWFRLLVKRAVVGQSKHVRVRPCFDDWSASGSIIVDNDQISIKILREIWGIAGLYIGLCDWRPGSSRSPGPYGRFKVDLTAA